MLNRQFFKESFSLITPYWISEEKKKAYSLLLLCVILNLGFVFMTIRINYWSRDIYNALETKSQAAFFKQVVYFFPLVFGFIGFFVSKNFTESYLAFSWRQWLTKKYLHNWTSNNIYYHVMRSSNHVDNPDQRISQDLNSMPVYTLNIFITVIKELVNVFSFGLILWNLSEMIKFTFFGLDINIPGYLIWAALLYAVIGSGLMVLIGKPLVKLDFMQERYEANFRFSLIRLQERREEIALYDGIFTEKKNLSNKFADIRENFYQIIRRKIYINICHNLYGNLANLFPLAVASPMYFAGVVTLGNLMQINGAFQQVKNSFSIIVDNFVLLASLRASIIRLAEFQDNIKKAHIEIANKKIKIHFAEKNNLVIKNLTINKPSGDLLKENINLTLESNDKLLIKGQSGAGKSTFIRMLKGIWNYGHGEIIFPKNKNIMFIPQKPYMPIDSLFNVIYYPQHDPSSKAKEQIILYMKQFKLTHLIPSLSDHQDWTNILSLGEQQRIAIIRILVNNPEIIILDEPTTSLDKDSEELVYKELFEQYKNKMIICVSHSEKFDYLFNKTLSM